jgi:hypothetical protein
VPLPEEATAGQEKQGEEDEEESHHGKLSSCSLWGRGEFSGCELAVRSEGWFGLAPRNPRCISASQRKN